MSRVDDAVEAIAAGRAVVVTDQADREDEGDLVVAADAIIAAHIAFMMTHCRGLICVPMTQGALDRLALPPMVARNTESHRTAFTVSVDAAAGITTGISAADRATTVRVLVDPASTPDDLARPGHVFPLAAVEGGVRERPGHTEAAVDLARLAGRDPSGVICEIAADDGTMLRGADLAAFAQRHGLPLVSIEELREHLAAREG
ncbi:3,4-dihydroxy-2-butanone-4-phosphate synthase [Cellulomonas soli]|uniref:3,4-dihydroxy-2-butanone 4-phosphate synthase n=1 Tax=Cellulomonas soli TaxID=931535 RepID=A0A512P8D0_9CELL|nr:3,4-dihydroxy-2-butanone-4-phosphate synthase [Cellulomonas soli]NYI57679.1 3,4-dihydroxy 2-butanone 4-phosphate synthase [Cellulomonas soli]GEP67457.1 3,4-dihydroxy-2-butanone 4-phosphate synthase [Cellulomonas soli]